MGKILARGHSRVPVYSGNPKNIIGLLLVGVAIIFHKKFPRLRYCVIFLITYCFLSFFIFLSVTLPAWNQVKSLLTVRPETETPVSAVSIRRIPRCVRYSAALLCCPQPNFPEAFFLLLLFFFFMFL